MMTALPTRADLLAQGTLIQQLTDPATPVMKEKKMDMQLVIDGQSKVLGKMREELDKLRDGVRDVRAEVGDLFGGLSARLEEMGRKVDPEAVEAGLGVFASKLADFGTRVTRIEEGFGDRYGKKLAALGHQVAELVKLGARISKVEASLAEVGLVLARIPKIAGGLDELAVVVERLMVRVERLEPLSEAEEAADRR